MGIVEKFSTGASVRRLEDERFVTGQGQYTDDVNIDGQVYMVVVRSPFAHAIIKSINTDDVKDADGVLGVYTGADFVAAGGANKMPYAIVGQESAKPDRTILADGRPPVCITRSGDKALSSTINCGLFISRDAPSNSPLAPINASSWHSF